MGSEEIKRGWANADAKARSKARADAALAAEKAAIMAELQALREELGGNEVLAGAVLIRRGIDAIRRELEKKK